MENEYLPEFGGTYLDDSYFLGALAEGGNLRLKFLFALTIDHPDYASPEEGEAHCYREGSMVIEQPSSLDWLPGEPRIMRDSNGTIDFGSIELYRHGPSRFRIVTEWFGTTVEVTHLRLEFSTQQV